MSASSSRTKRILSLALNKQLQEKVSSMRESTRTVKTSPKKELDPDYSPENMSCSSESVCENEVDILPSTPKKLKIPDTPECSKICILQDVLICPATKQRILDDIDVNTLDDSENVCTFIMVDILTHAMDLADAKLIKKDGSIRKRKACDQTPTERKEKKIENYIRNHFVQRSCKCPLKCLTKIKYQRQVDINTQFWQMTKNEQNMFVSSCIKKNNKKRNTAKQNALKRQFTFSYYLNNGNDVTIQVCKIFLLATLGFKKGNDRILKNVRNTDSRILKPKPDQRCHGHSSKSKVDKSVIVEHINSFGPTISHYRREHAPNRKYLPSDISITHMYNDFKKKYNASFSYELYRKVVTDMNISFANLGHEECWDCEEYRIHKESNFHSEPPSPTTECEKCTKYFKHKESADRAREEYKRDSKLQTGPDELIVSADLQKVIMLPRLETFKEIIFTPRIIAFNESFVPVGSNNRCYPWAVIWHEAIAGRTKHDIISTFYAFLLANRDSKRIVIWLDNCASQNKNWTLISFFIYVVNSHEVALEQLELKFFEPGHTFMSADSFHHQVELSLKKKKVYDFGDFKDTVQNANSGKVNVIEMKLQNFYTFTDYTSKHKLQNLDERVYLKDIVQMNFQRDWKYFSYKTNFLGTSKDLNDVFLAKFKKYQLNQPKQRGAARGVTSERKNNLIQKLESHVPANRLLFWRNIPVSENISDSE